MAGVKKKTVIFNFKQSINQQDNLHPFYALFKEFCSGVPILSSYKENRTEKVYSYASFTTYTAGPAPSCFIELFNFFYLQNIKIIPSILGVFLTPVSLAYWICDKGVEPAQGNKIY